MSKENKNLVVGLDIGTSKVVAIVGRILPDNRLNIIGMGGHESKGLKKGVVVNIEATVSAIQRALEEAELMADCKIARRLYRHRRQPYQELQFPRHGRDQGQGSVGARCTARDRDRARSAMPTDQQILHILTQEFIIDGQDGVREPLGMSGMRLEVEVHIVTGAVSAAQNIVKCVRRCGLEVNDLILQPLASASPCSPKTKRSWACAWWTSAAAPPTSRFSREGAIRHTAVIPIAGDQITNDIAMALRTPTAGGRGNQDQKRLRAAPAGRRRRADGGARHRRSRLAHSCRARRWPK